MIARTDWGIAICLAAAVVIGGAAVMTPGVTGAYHDDAVYVSTAKALATGQGYRLIDLPGSPPQTKYPILYPALLAVIWKIYPAFPDNVVVMQWFTLLCGAAATSLAYLYLVVFGYAGRLGAAAAGALTATTPLLAYLYGLTLSEPLFSLLVVTALWRLEWHVAQPAVSRGGAVVSGLLLALPFLSRSPGIVPIAAGLAVLAWRRVPVGWVLTGVVIVSAPWLIWSLGGAGAFQANAISGYYTDYAGAWTSLALPLTGYIAAWNGFMLAYGTLALPLQGVLDLVGGSIVGPGMLVFGVVVWVGMLRAALKRRLLPVMLIFYAAMLLVWPWPPARFLIPMLPLVLGAALGALGRKLPGGLTPRATHVVVVGLAALLALNALSLSRRSMVNREFGYPYYAAPDDPAHWDGFTELFDWIRTDTDNTAILAAPLDGMVSLYTGRKAFRPFVHRPDRLFYGVSGPPVGTCSELLTIMTDAGSEYLVVTPMASFLEAKPFNELVASCAADHSLNLVHEGRDRRFQVFRRTSPGRPGDR